MYVDQEKQMHFHEGWFLPPEVDPEHELIQLTHAIDWDRITDAISQFYSKSTGRPTKPARAKIGLLILKHRYQLSDEEVVDMLKRDLYFQYFCDVHVSHARKFIDPSTLTYFRKQIGIEGVQLLEAELFRFLKENKKLKGRKLVADTTVVPSPIQYPTDIHLLEKLRRKLVGLIDQARTLGAPALRTYKRVAKRTFIIFQKLRKCTKRFRRKIQKKMIRFADRNLRQLQKLKTQIKDSAPQGSRWKESAQKLSEIASVLLDQQKRLTQGKEVRERIVSLWAPHIRPMVRGKYPVEVEFGPKVLCNLKNGFLFLQDLAFENKSDQTWLSTSIQDYQHHFGHIPSELALDRGFFSQANVQLASEAGISKIAIQPKGKSPPGKSPAFVKRLRRLRCSIEAKISLAKRRYGLDRLRYRIAGGEEMWIRMGLLAMNYKHALNSS